MVWRLVSQIREKWPLQKQLGFYAYLPLFFAVGACVELVMINLKIGDVDFYSVYIRKEWEKLQRKNQLDYEVKMLILLYKLSTASI